MVLSFACFPQVTSNYRTYSQSDIWNGRNEKFHPPILRSFLYWETPGSPLWGVGWPVSKSSGEGLFSKLPFFNSQRIAHNLNIDATRWSVWITFLASASALLPNPRPPDPLP